MEISLEKGAIILNGILSGSKTYGKEKIQILEKKGKNLIFTMKKEEKNEAVNDK